MPLSRHHYCISLLRGMNRVGEHMTDNETKVIDTNELIAQRRTKLADIRKKRNAYPNNFHRDSFAKFLHEQHENKTEPQLEAQPIHVKIAGRVMTKRLMGKASF